MNARGAALVGRDALVTQFKNYADTGKLAHGYIFHGPQGVGKYSFAASLARYMEEKEFAIPAGRPLGDMHVIAPLQGERSVGIESVREIKHFLAQRPNRSERRTLIIDSAEQLTAEAEHALLKITEEPFPSSLLILVATDPEDFLPTLRSRFQQIYFAPLSLAALVSWIVERLDCAAPEAEAIARMSFGRPGLALRMKQDDAWKAIFAAAEDFLAARNAKAIVKTLTDDETFSLDAFLEALMIRAFPALLPNTDFWHALFRVREESRRFGLNAKLQLTALHKALQS